MADGGAIKLLVQSIYKQVCRGPQTIADSLEKTINPIGGTFLSRQSMRKLRTVTEGCISFSVS